MSNPHQKRMSSSWTRVCRPSAEAAEEAEQIAVRIDDNELPIAGFFVALTIPAVFKRHMNGCTVLHRLRVKGIHVGDLDLEVHSSPKRIFQGSGPKAAPRSVRLFQHQMNWSTGQIGESFLGAFNTATEPKDSDVERQGAFEIGHIESGNDRRCAG